MKKSNNKKGVSLVELIASIVLISFVFLLASLVMQEAFVSLPTTQRLSDAQVTARFVASVLTKRVEQARQLTTVPPNTAVADLLKDEWHYFGLTADKSQIVDYRYVSASDSYQKQVIADVDDRFSYNLNVWQANTTKNLVDFTVEVLPVDGSATALSSKVRAGAAVSLVCAPTAADLHQGFIYRDVRKTAVDVTANVMLVTDLSASMLRDMQNNTTSNVAEQRISKLQNALLGGIEDEQVYEGLVEGLAKVGGIELCLLPYNLNANYVDDYVASTAPYPYPYQTLTEQAEKTNAKDIIEHLATNTNSGANLGDALRRLYYCQQWFNSNYKNMPEYSHAAGEKDFVIVVLDGQSTMFSVTGGTSGAANAVYLDDNGAVSNVLIDDLASTASAQRGVVVNRRSDARDYSYQMIKKFKNDPNTKFYFVVIGENDDAAGLCDLANYVDTLCADLATTPNTVYNIVDTDSFSAVFADIAADIMRQMEDARRTQF